MTHDAPCRTFAYKPSARAPARVGGLYRAEASLSVMRHGQDETKRPPGHLRSGRVFREAGNRQRKGGEFAHRVERLNCDQRPDFSKVAENVPLCRYCVKQASSRIISG
jgi:hypothetical protein